MVVALDPGVDKDWIAVGPDPKVSSRDNIYVTWDSYDQSGTNSTMAFSPLNGRRGNLVARQDALRLHR